MQCNIDAKGKALRLTYGLGLLVIAGLVAGLWGYLADGGTFAWTVSAALAVSGAFMIFEGWAGWCVVRAMGFRTKY